MRLGTAWLGAARQGKAWRGKARGQISTNNKKENEMSTVARRATSQPKEVTRELIAAWEQKRPSLKALNDATLTRPRGYAIQAERCIEICGTKEEFSKVAKFWKMSVLWVSGITIEYEPASKSYRFIEVERHLTNRNERLLKAVERKHREESLRLSLIRDADLESDHRRALRLLLRNQHSDAAGKIESQREFARLAVTRPETLPKIV